MTRVEVALAEIARRRELAQAATPGPWTTFFGRVNVSGSALFYVSTTGGYNDPPFLAANDPAHVLAVLDAAEAVLRRHTGPVLCALCSNDFGPWPCPDAAVFLDIYAPEATP